LISLVHLFGVFLFSLPIPSDHPPEEETSATSSAAPGPWAEAPEAHGPSHGFWEVFHMGWGWDNSY